MKIVRWSYMFQALLLFELASGNACADGGVVRFRGVRGPFVVTIFTTPAPTPDSASDVSLLVQRKDSNDPILDATVDLLFTPPPLSAGRPIGQLCGLPGVALLGQKPGQGAMQPSVRATRAQASNKLLYAAPIRFGVNGNWTLDALVTCGSDSARASCVIAVGPPASRLIGLLPYLLLPPLGVILFAINQTLRKKPRLQA
jgi:hypothetical protein